MEKQIIVKLKTVYHTPNEKINRVEYIDFENKKGDSILGYEITAYEKVDLQKGIEFLWKSIRGYSILEE